MHYSLIVTTTIRGGLESILRGNGVRTGFAYDAASRLEELATELEGSTPSEIRTLGFDYNPAGQITERTDTGGSFAFSGHTDQTSIYDHNALNQIINITETGAVTRTLTPQWTAGNLTSDGERSFGSAEPRARNGTRRSSRMRLRRWQVCLPGSTDEAVRMTSQLAF